MYLKWPFVIKKKKDPNSRKSRAHIYHGGLLQKITKHEAILINVFLRAKIEFAFQEQFSSREYEKLYFPDFVITATTKDRYIVEVDDPSHNKKEFKDSQRTEILIKSGKYKEVIRFTNKQIENDLKSVIDEIWVKVNPLSITDEEVYGNLLYLNRITKGKILKNLDKDILSEFTRREAIRLGRTGPDLFPFTDKDFSKIKIK